MVRYSDFLSNRKQGSLLSKVYKALKMEARKKPERPDFAALIKGFLGVVLEWHKNRANKRWSADYASRLLSNMDNHIFPSIAHLPLPLLKAKHFAILLKGIEELGDLEVTSRTRQQICNIMHYTVQRGLVENNLYTVPGKCHTLSG